MTDTGGGDAGGGGFFSRFIGAGRMPKFQMQGITEAQTQVNALNTSVSNLLTTLNGITSNSGGPLTAMLGRINTAIGQTQTSINNLNAAAGSAGSGAGGGGAGAAASGGGGGGGFAGRFASGAISSLMSGGGDILKDLAMFPLRFIEQTVGTNRQTAMNISTALAGQMYATGATEQQTAASLARFPGGVQGSPEDMINLVNIARQAGAFLDPARLALGGDQPGNRTTGFLKAVQQAQIMTPGVAPSQIAATIGGYSGNVQAQQQSAYLTGGAFSMIGQGGRHKSLSEWAENILKWFENLRGGADKGKPFSYGQLVAQYFPGSNIDAWFNANQVPEGMREYWWDYALAKSRTAKGQGEMEITTPRAAAPGQGNLAFDRLQTIASQGRAQLNLSSQMTGSYSNKEQANRWFSDLMGQVTSEVIPNQMSQGALSALQFMPDSMEELLLSFLERSGPVGALIGGGIGYGIHGASSLMKNLMGMFTGGLGGLGSTLGGDDMGGALSALMGQFQPGGTFGSSDATGYLDKINSMLPSGYQIHGDAPASSDIGDTSFTNRGNTSLSGLHPDMKKRLGNMMAANPKLSVTSGMRDTWQQMQLKNQGHTRVSGKPSAHTRGQAADLGPSSQYPWIMANAAKFGLKSGRNVGEPWHVGMGDVDTPWGFGIGDDGYTPTPAEYADAIAKMKAASLIAINGVYPDATGLFANYMLTALTPTWSASAQQRAISEIDQYLTMTGVVPGTGGHGPTNPSSGNAPVPTTPNTGSQAVLAPNPLSTATSTLGQQNSPSIGSLLSLLTGGFDKENVINTIGAAVPNLMTLFLGLFGMGKPTAEGQAGIQYQPDVYQSFLMASKKFSIGGIQASPGGTLGTWTPRSTTTTGATPPGTTPPVNTGPARSLIDALTAAEVPARTPAPSALSTGGLIARLAFAAGFRGDDVAEVVGISNRESGWDPSQHYSGPKDDSYGLMQINMLGSLGPDRRSDYNLKADSDLYDPWTNMSVAHGLWGQSSNSFRPWNKNGSPLNMWRAPAANMDVARNIAREAGVGDIESAQMALLAASEMSRQGVPRSTVPGVGPDGGVMFNNTFVINAGSGGDPRGGGIDVRRTVSVIADHLETEMKKRVSRRN